MSSLWHTNNRLKGTHLVRSPELSEPNENSLSSVFETVPPETVFGGPFPSVALQTAFGSFGAPKFTAFFASKIAIFPLKRSVLSAEKAILRPCLGPRFVFAIQGRALYGPIPVKTETFRDFERHWSVRISGEIHMDQSLVHTFSWGNFCMDQWS